MSVSATVLAAWLGWVSLTLIRLQSDVAVLKYEVLGVSPKYSLLKPDPAAHPLLATPGIPVGRFRLLGKENDNEKRD